MRTRVCLQDPLSFACRRQDSVDAVLNIHHGSRTINANRHTAYCILVIFLSRFALITGLRSELMRETSKCGYRLRLEKSSRFHRKDTQTKQKKFSTTLNMTANLTFLCILYSKRSAWLLNTRPRVCVVCVCGVCLVCVFLCVLWLCVRSVCWGGLYV